LDTSNLGDNSSIHGIKIISVSRRENSIIKSPLSTNRNKKESFINVHLENSEKILQLDKLVQNDIFVANQEFTDKT
jgi:hypothetical protein